VKVWGVVESRGQGRETMDAFPKADTSRDIADSRSIALCVCVCKGAVDEQKFHLSLQRLEAMRLFRASSPRARILNAAYTFICIHSTEVQLVPHVGLFRWCCISKERSGTHLSVSRVRRARSMNRVRL